MLCGKLSRRYNVKLISARAKLSADLNSVLTGREPTAIIVKMPQTEQKLTPLALAEYLRSRIAARVGRSVSEKTLAVDKIEPRHIREYAVSVGCYHHCAYPSFPKLHETAFP